MREGISHSPRRWRENASWVYGTVLAAWHGFGCSLVDGIDGDSGHSVLVWRSFRLGSFGPTMQLIPVPKACEALPVGPSTVAFFQSLFCWRAWPFGSWKFGCLPIKCVKFVSLPINF